jgi:ABC-type antimicrobial peptide transport system permease subunit
VGGSRLARRRRVLLGVGIGAALLAIGGLIGASFVKSPQQLAADTAPPAATVTTATVVSQVLTSSVQMRGVVYPATQYDVYVSAPSSGSPSSSSSSRETTFIPLSVHPSTPLAAALPAPLIGTLVGLLAGAYPALRAARTSPLAALRHA